MVQILYGENAFALREHMRGRVNEFVSTHGTHGLVRIDGSDTELSVLRAHLLQLPFLTERVLVVITDLFSSSALCSAFVDLIDAIPESIDVMLVDPKPDKRTKLYKLLQSQKAVHEFNHLRGSELQKWVIEYAKAEGSNILPSDAQKLIDRIGTDQMRLSSEITKLSYAPHITPTDIDELTEASLESSVFDLLAYVFSGDRVKALAEYDALLVKNTDPSEIMGLIAWQLHVFCVIKYAPEPSSQALASSGLHPFVISKALNIVKRLKVDSLELAVTRALHTDQLIKTGKADAQDALRVLLLEFSSM